MAPFLLLCGVWVFAASAGRGYVTFPLEYDRRWGRVAEPQQGEEGDGEWVEFVGKVTKLVITIGLGVGNAIPTTVMLDTGSRELILPTSNCQSCGKTYSYSPQPPNGFTYMNCSGPCTYAIGFTDGTVISCLRVFDRLTVGAGTASALEVDTPFWGIYSMNPVGDLVDSGSDGIFGLSFDKPDSEMPLTKLLKQNSLNNKFSIQAGIALDSRGAFTLGEPDPEMYQGELHPLPLVAPRNLYRVALHRVAVGTAPLPREGVMFAVLDTGSANIMMGKSLYSSFVAEVQKAYTAAQSEELCYTNHICGARSLLRGYCWPRRPALAGLPAVNFTFDGLSVIIPPEAYVRQIPFKGSDGTSSRSWCLGISPSEATSTVLLGCTFLSQVYAVFDRDSYEVSFGTPSGKKPHDIHVYEDDPSSSSNNAPTSNSPERPNTATPSAPKSTLAPPLPTRSPTPRESQGSVPISKTSRQPADDPSSSSNNAPTSNSPERPNTATPSAPKSTLEPPLPTRSPTSNTSRQPAEPTNIPQLQRNGSAPSPSVTRTPGVPHGGGETGEPSRPQPPLRKASPHSDVLAIVVCLLLVSSAAACAAGCLWLRHAPPKASPSLSDITEGLCESTVPGILQQRSEQEDLDTDPAASSVNKEAQN